VHFFGTHDDRAMKTYSLAYLIGVATVALSLTTIGCGSPAQKPDAAAGGGSGGSSGGGNGGGGARGGSGGAGSGTCGKVLPCGGDLVGTWTLTENCRDLPIQPEPTCPGERITSWTATILGGSTWTFNANMTYSRSVTATSVVVWSYPLSCIIELSSSCADFAADVQATLDPDEMITCTETDPCICTVSVGSRTTTDNGTYQTAGTNVTFTSAVTGATGTAPYCVQGSRLHLVTLDARAANGIASDLVGEKR
jgi:hypothetical protein